MKKVALFFGGLGNESDVSIVSAKNVVKNFDYKKYELILVFWNKKDSLFYKVKDINKLVVGKGYQLKIEDFTKTFDIALLMTHGKYGEDGVLQAIFESQKIKYCGCRVLGSALCMDKAVFKDLLCSSKINQVAYRVVDFKRQTKNEIADTLSDIVKNLPLPWYVKPANSGSSVGITKVDKIEDLAKAINLAKKHDSKLVIEQGLKSPKEIEVAVLGNQTLLVSRPGELRLAKDFYNYEDKYKLGQAQAVIPADISPKQIAQVQELATKAYHLFNCQGFSRIDFFLHDGKIYLNEINTLPGFTDISMFPMLMMDTGLSYKQLINKIIELGY
jgi:D-alanine-D-alanine ligase